MGEQTIARSHPSVLATNLAGYTHLMEENNDRAGRVPETQHLPYRDTD